MISSFGCSYETADIEFGFTLSQAREKGDHLAHHLIQSFAPGEVGYEEAHQIGKKLADKGHLHNHIMFCAADFVTHHKYISNKKAITRYGMRAAACAGSMVYRLSR